MAFPGQDPNVYGDFPRGSGFGATVFGFSSNVQWGNQTYNLNLDIVEDFAQNDDFWFKEEDAGMLGGQFVGRPFSFSYGQYYFAGILKAVDQINDPGAGNPIYRVTLASPWEILQSTQVVLADYIGSVSDYSFNGTPQGISTFQVSNLINVYGYCEDGGNAFGRSLVTEIGMPWLNDGFGISEAIQTLTNTPPNIANQNPQYNFGSYLVFKGNYYSVDLSNLPVPPTYYRLGGAINMNLMDLLDQFFQDAGVDYIIKLTLNENNSTGPHRISFVTVPHSVQQQLGLIPAYIQSQSNIATVSRGQELRSDITQAFLVGGPVNFLEQVVNNGSQPTIIPFFGFDINGFPIVGFKANGQQYADDDYAFNLNASAVADILGEVGNGLYVYPQIAQSYIPIFSYPTTILELRCALGDFDTWAIYLSIYQPYLANLLNIQGGFTATNPNGAQTIVDLVNDSRGLASTLGKVFSNNHWMAVAQKLYDFVRKAADIYYGKKFIVLLPFGIQVKIDPITFVTSFNDTIADAGYAPEGVNILDLNFVNENFFLDQTGRFTPFVEMLFTNSFNSIGTLVPEGNPNLPSLPAKTVVADLTTLNTSAAIVQWELLPQTVGTAYNNSKIFVSCNSPEDPSPVQFNGAVGIGGGLIFYVQNNVGIAQPATVMSISDAVWCQAEDILGSTMDLSALMNSTPVNGTATLFPLTTNAFQALLANHSAPTQLVIHPPAIYPYAAALAIDSSQYTYGPWGQFNTDGKLSFEQDQGLVPWAYGSYDQMNLAAQAKLNTIAKGNQVLERGDWTEAGLPKASLGDILIDGGPVLTSVKCDIDPNRVTTSYRMETFVNRAGAFIIENQQRLQQIGKIYQQIRRTIRQGVLQGVQNQNTFLSAYNGFMYGTTYALQDQSPHAVMSASLIAGNGNNYIPQAYAQTYQESLRSLGVNDDGTYNDNVAAMGYEGLFRAYSYDFDSESLPSFMPPGTGYTTDQLITSSGAINLNPFQAGCDITWILNDGDNYQGMRTSVNQVNWQSTRGIALRSPLVLQGWGYDFQGAPMPNQGNYLIDDDGNAYPNLFNTLQEQTNQFFSGYLSNSYNWQTGPLDVAWDKFRGVWASRGMVICGETSGTGPTTNFTGNSPNFLVYVNGQKTGESMYIANHLSSPVPTGVRAIAGYDPLGNRWVFLQSDCSPNS